MAALLSQIIESLWGMGISEAQLRGVPTKDLPTFKAALKRQGVTDDQINRAQALAEWRADPKKTTRQNLGSLLQTMGIPQETINRIIHPVVQNPDGTPKTYSSADLVASVNAALGGQVGTNLAIKLNEPAAISPGAPEWNPFRGDKPKAPAPAAAARPPKVWSAVERPGAAPPAPLGDLGRAVTAGTEAGAGAGAGETTLAPIAPVDTTPALGPGATEEQVRKYVTEHYSSYAYLYDVPELKDKVLRPAVTEGWDVDRILGALETTTWWKKTESSARLFKEEKYRDPGTVADRVRGKYEKFKALARERGITGIPDKELREMAEDSEEFGWDDQETTAALGRWFKYDPTNLMGAAHDTAVQIRQLHKSYLVPLSEPALKTWTEKVIRGEATADDFEDYLKTQAVALFPMFKSQIDIGVTPDQWVDPYRQIAAQELGLSPEAIDFRDPKWMAAVDELDLKTNQRRPMYLNDWRNKIKTDDAYGWDKTAAGREHGARLAKTMAQTFGRS